MRKPSSKKTVWLRGREPWPRCALETRGETRDKCMHTPGFEVRVLSSQTTQVKCSLPYKHGPWHVMRYAAKIYGRWYAPVRYNRCAVRTVCTNTFCDRAACAAERKERFLEGK